MAKKSVGRPSAVETSPHRRDIEEMLKEGKTPDFISTWLKSVGESISNSAIYRYRRDKFNIQAEAIKKYNNEKSKERLDKASDEILQEIKYLDKVIDIANTVKLNLNVQHDFDKETPLKVENHKLNIIKAGIQATKVKSDIFKEDPETNINLNLNPKEEDLTDLFDEKIKELRSEENVSSE